MLSFPRKREFSASGAFAGYRFRGHDKVAVAFQRSVQFTTVA